MSELSNALKQQGGCGLIMIAFGLFMFGGMIYWFIWGGNPEAGKFLKECYSRHLSEYAGVDWDAIPESAKLAIIRSCDDAQKRYLRLKSR